MIDIPEDGDIGSSNNVTGYEPSQKPTAEPTTAMPSFEPTLQPTHLHESPEAVTSAPTVEPGAPSPQPTLYSTHASTIEPCVDEYWVYSPKDDPNGSAMAMLKGKSHLKPCKQFPGFKESMKMVGKLPSLSVKSNTIENDYSQETSIASSHPIASAKAKSEFRSVGEEYVDKVALVKASKKNSVEDMTVEERRAFYLAHFATPEQRATAAARGEVTSSEKGNSNGSAGRKQSVEDMSTEERRKFYLAHFATPEQRAAARAKASAQSEAMAKRSAH